MLTVDSSFFVLFTSFFQEASSSSKIYMLKSAFLLFNERIIPQFAFYNSEAHTVPRASHPLFGKQALCRYPTHSALFSFFNLETGLYEVAQGGFKLVTLLPQPPVLAGIISMGCRD